MFDFRVVAKWNWSVLNMEFGSSESVLYLRHVVVELFVLFALCEIFECLLYVCGIVSVYYVVGWLILF